MVNKYREAAKIADTALEGVLRQLKPGALISDICDFGDSVIEAATGKLFKTKKIEKGVAFPTCISVNETVCHYSPFKSESKFLNKGDMVKM